jgi:hypothetical protein
MPSDKLTVQALSLIASGAPAQALRVLGAPRGGQGQGLLRAALREYLLTARGRAGVKDPAPFQAFITGGGNVALHRATSAVRI